jgi:hypothetical protein
MVFETKSPEEGSCMAINAGNGKCLVPVVRSVPFKFSQMFPLHIGCVILVA